MFIYFILYQINADVRYNGTHWPNVSYREASHNMLFWLVERVGFKRLIKHYYLGFAGERGLEVCETVNGKVARKQFKFSHFVRVRICGVFYGKTRYIWGLKFCKQTSK